MKNFFFLIAALFCLNSAFANEPEEASVQETAQTAETAPSAEASEETVQADSSSCGCTRR